MTEENKKDSAYKKIEKLLSNYEDGWDIFKKAKDWDDPITILDSSKDKDIPQSWIELADEVISIVAHERYGLDTYDNVIEIIDSDDMLASYASVGMPINYEHWSFGKHLMAQEEQYKQGQMGLAYEIVINTDPAIAYCMEQNTKTMQMLVIAHASYGHNSFFKGNYMFQQFTKPAEILDTLRELKDFVSECETRHGEKRVERLLDACHALQSHGVYHTSRPPKRSKKEEKARRKRMEKARRKRVNLVMDRTTAAPKSSEEFNQKASNDNRDPSPDAGEENLLKYIAASAPHLKQWERKIVSMVSDVAQYFYPQRQLQLMNEGWATFWHHTILTDLNDMGLIDDGMMLEFLDSHSGVTYQPDFDETVTVMGPDGQPQQVPIYSGINPYALGFEIFKDIKRICEEPTEEDREWFPDIAGKGDWLPVLKEAMQNFKDEGFIMQYLSPKVIRDFGFFAITDDERNLEIEVSAIHDSEGYEDVRTMLSDQYNLGSNMPRIEVDNYNYRGDRSLTLRHVMNEGRPVDKRDMDEVLKHIKQLWGHQIILNSVDEEGHIVDRMGCPKLPVRQQSNRLNKPYRS
jgi:spore cortex formation protein SpoVR/YcgB (stage V sporulation)